MKNTIRLLDVYDQPIETPLNHFLFQEIEEEVVEERFETALPPLSPPPPHHNRTSNINMNMNMNALRYALQTNSLKLSR